MLISSFSTELKDALAEGSSLSEGSTHLATVDEGVIHYQLFCVAWAIATLFHLAQSRIYTSELHYALLTLAAIGLIIKPGSVIRLGLLILLQLYGVALQLPGVSNHWLFTTFVNLTILQALIYLIIRGRSLAVRPGELIRTFGPAVRLELLLLYFFTVLHKLNRGFFSPAFSCAGVLYKAQNAQALLPVTLPILQGTIYLTITVELLIPGLLFFRKTRNVGLLLGLAFHGTIALNPFNGFYDFSGMIFGVYLLFAGPAFSATVYAARQKLLATRLVAKRRLAALTFQNAALVLLLMVVGLAALLLITKKIHDYFRLAWAAYGFLFMLLFLLSLASGKPAPRRAGRGFRLPNAAFLLFPALVFLNGLSPYIGLKTESSFAMFSNLRTEGGVTNHFFIPVRVQVFNYQKDLVEIVASSDPQLQKVADEQKLMTFFQFKNQVAAVRPAVVDYIRNGQRRTFRLATAAPADELLHQSPLLLRKLLAFRTISKTEPQPCQH